MIDIFNLFKEKFSSAIKEIAQENNSKNTNEKQSEKQIIFTESDLKNFTVEPTKDKMHGDLACNIAMLFSKKFNHIESLNNPRKLAQKIIEKISNANTSSEIQKIEIAGPGFINLFLSEQIFQRLINDLVLEKNFIFPNLAQRKFENESLNAKINLEYASPNPTGPIHIGHTRGAIYGDVLATLLKKVGYEVLKEYYINDAGSQIITLLKSAYLRYLEACGKNIEIPEGLYPGNYLIEIGASLKEKFGFDLIEKKEEDYLPLIRDFVVESMIEIIKSDLLALGIKHDSYFSEKKNLHDTNQIEATLKILEEKNLIYVGKLEAPKTEKGVGALPEGYDNKDQTLFRSTKFGDDQDRVIKKSDGSLTYFAGDIAYAASKYKRGARIFIMPLGADHAGYVKRLSAAVDAITNGEARLKVILCQMVKFVKNGQPLKMSKRAGNFITAREVIDEVGADALRFIMLTRKNDAPFDFDLAQVIEQSKDNPIFYVQYAHARCCSVLRNFASEKIQIKELENSHASKDLPQFLTLLKDESEIELMKKIASFCRIIEMAALNFEPHRLAFYLQELAAEFHAFWNKGTENPDLKFIIKENLELTKARIYLVLAVKKVISTGLEIFNIKAVEEMR